VQTVGYEESVAGEFTARRRHIDALKRAHQGVISGREQLTQNSAGELLAEELSQAQQAINEITGEFTSDDLLGKIFSSFCIGK
jgi:tRNA modification GTPase